MSSRSGTEMRAGSLLFALGLACLLGGCSDIYWDRRDSIALWSGDAQAGNKVVEMIDPWPASSANKNIAFNGERAQAAIERYRQNKVIPPVNATTSSVQYQPAQSAAQAAATAAGSAAAAAPVK